MPRTALTALCPVSFDSPPGRCSYSHFTAGETEVYPAFTCRRSWLERREAGIRKACLNPELLPLLVRCLHSCHGGTESGGAGALVDWRRLPTWSSACFVPLGELKGAAELLLRVSWRRVLWEDSL